MSIAELPKELEELIINSQKEKVKIKVKKNSNKKEYTEVKDIQIGERNETLFRLSSKLIETGLCYDSILNAINIENKLKCIEPLSENEIVNIVNSSYKFKDNKRIANNSINKIFSGKYNIKAIAIYWSIWFLSLETLKGKIYISQANLCKMLGIKTINTLRENMEPLIKDNLIQRTMTKKNSSGFGVYSYKVN